MRVNGLYETFVLPVGIPVGSPIRVREAEAVEYTVPDSWSVALRVTQEELDAAAASAREVADVMLDEMDRAMQDQEDARARAAMPIYESEDVPKGMPLRNVTTGAIYAHPDDAGWAEAIARGWKRIESGWIIPDLLLQPVACYGGLWRAGVGLAGLFQDFPSEETALRAALDNPRYKREGDT